MSRGRILLLVLAIAVVILVGMAATGRLPLFTRTWEGLTSADASPSSSAGPVTSASGDAGPPAGRRVAALSSAQLGAPLVHGTFVTACGAPQDMKVVVKVAVKMGRAVKVTVTTDPPDPTIAACIDHAARDLRWDVSPKTDHVTVTY
jgi:hypothetical protein